MFKLNVHIALMVTLLSFSTSSFSQKDTLYYEFNFDINDWVTFLDDTISDIDGNQYGMMQFGDQVWMDRNLSVTRFNDGTEILKPKNKSDWSTDNSPLCTYGPQHVLTLYYNYYVAETDNLCPTGWHVPSSVEWSILLKHFQKMNQEFSYIFLPDSIYALQIPIPFAKGLHFIEKDSTIYKINVSYDLAFNENALFFSGGFNTHVGYIYQNGDFINNGQEFWWASDSVNSAQSWNGEVAIVGRLNLFDLDKNDQNNGLSIRCIKDDN